MDVHTRAFHAHSTTNPDKSDWQPLREHLEAVAEIAARNASAFSADALAHLAGLLHDLGKYTDEFQRRITGDPIRVDQAGPGGRKVSRPTRARGLKHPSPWLARSAGPLRVAQVQGQFGFAPIQIGAWLIVIPTHHDLQLAIIHGINQPVLATDSS